MHPIIQMLEQEQMQGKIIPAFSAGDTVVVQINIIEGDRQRLQSFEGIVIAKKNRGLNSAFTVRKISHGEGVERVFQTYSPQIASIIVKRKGDVRKAKIYYLRKLSGRKARIREKIVSTNTGTVNTAATNLNTNLNQGSSLNSNPNLVESATVDIAAMSASQTPNQATTMDVVEHAVEDANQETSSTSSS